MADLRDAGWEISAKTVADSMRRHPLVTRRIRRRNGLTKQDRTAPKFPDLLKRDFTAATPNCRWVGDQDPDRSRQAVPGHSDRPVHILGAGTGLHSDARLACDAIKIAVATRGVRRAIWREDEAQRVNFLADRGCQYTSILLTEHLQLEGIAASIGSVGDSLLTGSSHLRWVTGVSHFTPPQVR